MARLRATTIFSAQRLTVTAIESLEFRVERTRRRLFLAGSREPIAVIVRQHGRTCAFDMAARPVDIERLELPADFDPA